MEEIPVQLAGTQFQLDVWEALRRVPLGGTITYGQLAAEAGYPKATRAVGSACGRNPVSIIVPCHRILPSHGFVSADPKTVGNYGGGPPRKANLLVKEAAAAAALG